MTYQETLDYLYSSLPMFQRVGKAAIKKDLTNTLALCQLLDNPHQKFKSVHIAGTNGKGTSAHSLAAILQAAGYKTGLYTSPHLKHFTERIRINGAEISRQEVVDFVAGMKEDIETIKPSFFEATVAMAFDHFARHQVDIAVVEVGLGGRLDSTNVITPEVSLITSIGFDHMDLLGNSLELIAGEKAGIIKKGVPVVVGSEKEELNHVFQKKAKEENSPLFFAGRHYTVESICSSLLKRTVNVSREGNIAFSGLELDITGDYYLKNLPGILKAVDVLKDAGFVISNEHIEEGLRNVKQATGLKGRWQLLGERPLTICDVGHNENGLSEIFEQIAGVPHQRLWVVMGIVSDKDRAHLWKSLPKEAYYFFTQASIPRALPAAVLNEEAQKAGFGSEAVTDVNEGIKLAREKASADDLIFIGGSTFVVAEIENL